ncbi:Dol-P-Man:Man(7)GlcNAc(2)-PP-Dol alpha-1 [Emericellopsis cladophorae]|uniref:Mannosyltransferase n=1 Tax=Emericellopsis cladophorae TaxID=2686198 RepID=A0A9P9Y975_9HYPO|nr:Dol-P-Man:Man(7)GlcNAc(2)-PP-Dol alpha-1 [Emericellopsis cladophorae]KAI6785893.1 Dol-P-Man:Man(7)GlcNAc(2)-PP-Dol alpha-1 [Emericellopsis cladophorae]
MQLADLQLSAVLIITPLLHLLFAPHTKVEESFNLQAAHDILVYGTPTHDVAARLASVYDHFTFPGAVPRSFIGAVVLSGLSQPLIWLSGFQHAQTIVRGTLGAFNIGCLLVLRQSLASAFGQGAARWWILLQVTQFHVLYYLTRTLPNMYSFGLTTLAFALILPRSSPAVFLRRRKQAIFFLTLSATIFRAETAILLVTITLHLLLTSQLTLRDVIPTFTLSFLFALAISVPIDSYFWQQWPLWPELAGFYFNAVKGSSSDWGVSSWHWYFTSALPRLFINPLIPLLIIFALYNTGTRRQALSLFVPSMAFVVVYSLQPHKETRFILYAVPPLTAVAALGADYIATRASRTTANRLVTYALYASLPLSLAMSSAMLALSALNYPGGEAITHLHSLLPPSSTLDGPMYAHADVLTCMTGLTLFHQNPHGLPLALANPDSASPDERALLVVDKTERDATLGYPRFWERLDYALEERSAMPMGDWEILGVISGYDGIEILKPGQEIKQQPSDVLGSGRTIAEVRDRTRALTGGWWVGPRMTPKINIMRRRDNV